MENLEMIKDAHRELLDMKSGEVLYLKEAWYDEEVLDEYMKEKGARIMLNSDCHSRDYLDCCYRESLEMIRKAGFTSMAVLTDNGFADMDIDQFTE